MSEVRGNPDFHDKELDEKLDHLALRYSRTKNENDLTDLIKEMIPICERDARSWSLRTGLDESDLLSVFIQSVQEASQGYKPIGLFLKRYHHFKKRKAIDLLRRETAMKRDNLNTLSLNSLVSKEDEGIEFVDTLQDYTSEFSSLVELRDLISRFKEKDPLYGGIIESLSQGKSNQEIAKTLGEQNYSELARKKVSLSRKKFKQFIN